MGTQSCKKCMGEIIADNAAKDGLCGDCHQQSQMNHDSTSDVIGFSSDWFEDNDIFDEFPGT
ncbi:MAG: hypothetical protein FWF59_01645 [Turicibacter sp.]|nr:hypothetical protein [Turicibacter sp.]